MAIRFIAELSSMRKWLSENLPIEPLVAFRMVFGLCMLVGTIRFMWLGWIDHHYIKPVFLFKYYGFEWVQAGPPWLLYALHVLLALSALGVMLGYYFRLSAWAQFLVFTYLELLDLSYYLNHYYFVSLASMLLAFTPAHKAYSLDVLQGRVAYSPTVPAWAIRIIQFQIGLVYFYAGIAKINSDWLFEALPLKIWLPASAHLPIIGPLLALPFTAYLFSWAGMLFDCGIAFLLTQSATRPYAYTLVVVFHSITGLLFQIGIFPIVMIGGTLIFFSARWHRRWLQVIWPTQIGKMPCKPEAITHNKRISNPALLAIAIYVSFQILFPFRYLLYPGNLFWTEEGYRFSWRVMLMEKAATATFYVKDAATGQEGVVLNADFLNEHQEKQMAMQPDMILQYAHFLARHYAAKGVHNPQIRAEVYVTLNGRPSQLLFDPHLVLNEIKDGWAPKKWLFPYSQETQYYTSN